MSSMSLVHSMYFLLYCFVNVDTWWETIMPTMVRKQRTYYKCPKCGKCIYVSDDQGPEPFIPDIECLCDVVYEWVYSKGSATKKSSTIKELIDEGVVKGVHLSGAARGQQNES